MPAREGSRRISLCLGAVALVLGCYAAAAGVAAVVPVLGGAGRLVAAGVVAGCLGGTVTWIAAPRLAGPRPPTLPPPPIVALPPETERLRRRIDLDRQLDRALGGTTDPAGVHDVVRRALTASAAPASRSELLLADGPQGYLVQVAEAGPDGEGPGCPVAGTAQCEALRRERTLRWASSDALDGCPHLADRDRTVCSAVCVPVRLAGRPAGVLHRTDTVDEPATELDVNFLEALAGRIEARLAVLHLTGDDTGPAAGHGLRDHDGVARTAAALLRANRPFTLARCDVTAPAAAAGPDPSPATLDAVARVALRVLRPDDVVGRGADGALLVVFPGTAADHARRVLDRLREEIVLELAGAELPPVRLAVGVVTGGAAGSTDELFAALDAAVATSSR